MHVIWWYSYTPSREPVGEGMTAAGLRVQKRWWPDSWRWQCLKLLCQDLPQDVLRSPDIQGILKDSHRNIKQMWKVWRWQVENCYQGLLFTQFFWVMTLSSEVSLKYYLFPLCTGADTDFIWNYKLCKFSFPFRQTTVLFLEQVWFSPCWIFQLIWYILHGICSPLKFVGLRLVCYSHII